MDIDNFSKRGFFDWLIQRLSAIVLLIAILIFFRFYLLNSPITFAKWHAFFNRLDILILTLLSFCAIALHSWVGMWTIITDYVKSEIIKKITIALLKIILSITLIMQIAGLIIYK